MTERWQERQPGQSLLPPPSHLHSALLSSPHLASPLSLLTSISVCLSLSLMSLHQTSWKIHSSAFNRSRQPPAPHPRSPPPPRAHRDTTPHRQIWVCLEKQCRGGRKQKLWKGLETRCGFCVVCVCVCVCVLGIHRSTWWRVLWAPEWACDVWQMTDSINFISHTYMNAHSHTHADSGGRYETTAPHVRRVNC